MQIYFLEEQSVFLTFSVYQKNLCEYGLLLK